MSNLCVRIANDDYKRFFKSISTYKHKEKCSNQNIDFPCYAKTIYLVEVGRFENN